MDGTAHLECEPIPIVCLAPLERKEGTLDEEVNDAGGDADTGGCGGRPRCFRTKPLCHNRFEDRFGHFFNRFDHFNRFDKFNAAPVDQSFGQEIGDTGDVNLSLGVANTGNNSNQCVAPMQFGNTGNIQNQQGFIQSGSKAGDVEFSGGSFVFAPAQGVRCVQSVEQAATASSW